MFMFSHYTLNAFSPRVFIRYKRHACLMAVLLFICGACCLAWPLVAGWYLATVTGMLLMICGFYSLYSLIVFRQQHWKSRLVALIFAIAWIVLGLSFVVNPLNGMSSLAILFGFLFVLGPHRYRMSTPPTKRRWLEYFYRPVGFTYRLPVAGHEPAAKLVIYYRLYRR